MPTSRTLTMAVLTASGLALAPAVAIAADSTPSSPAPAATSTSFPTAVTAKSTEAGAGLDGVKPIQVDKPIIMRLDSKGNIDKSALPDEGSVFSQRELAQILPGLKSVQRTDDTLTLGLAGEGAEVRSRMVVKLKRFGKKDAVTKAWDSERDDNEKRESRTKGLYTFFGKGTFGAADSFTDGTTTHVLLTRGDAAGEIWFSGVGFTKLADDYADSRKAYRELVVPALVHLLADKVKAAPSQETSSSSSAKPSPSRTSSVAPAKPSSPRPQRPVRLMSA